MQTIKRESPRNEIPVTWLQYTDDEVAIFHPEFLQIATIVLRDLGASARYHWEHHPSTPGVDIVPDFVLVETATNRWWLVVEVKRSRASVFSERSQIQAKGYAESNQNLFVATRARYFCVTNLESTLLFAINGTNPVRECRVENMAFDSGSFNSTPIVIHKLKFKTDLNTLVDYVLGTATPIFDVVWPRIVRALISHTAAITFNPRTDLNAGTLPAVVASYFAGCNGEAPTRELLLRCLIAEYLKGILTKYQHNRAAGLPVLNQSVLQAANIIDVLMTIDFQGIFEATAPALYRDLVNFPGLKSSVEGYLQSLLLDRVDLLARRNDALEFPEALISEAYPLDIQGARGKAQTDPDLAALLASLTIDCATDVILDPGCGDGSLLSAAYDALRFHGATHTEALARLKGLDADSVVTKIAALRLALKEPHVISPNDINNIFPGDMFSSAAFFNGVNVVLMNPPFKRYEAQDTTAIPTVLRQHFRGAISAISGAVETDIGQANIYNLYAEYVIKASGPNTIFGIILDNRWYHNRASLKLRELLLRECTVLAVVSYPHDLFFEDWTIATSLFVAIKARPTAGHQVHFIRTNDPRRADFTLVARALRGMGAYPPGWHTNQVAQADLSGDSWQQHFSKDLTENYRTGLLKLNDLFTLTRRGSLAKEGGGIAVYEFPFGRTDYGPQRTRKSPPRLKFQTVKGRPLATTENSLLRNAAGNIPATLRGYAIQNSDQLTNYVLSIGDVTQDETLEAPIQRTPHVQVSYFRNKRRAWDATLNRAVAQIRVDPCGAIYIALVKQLVGLNQAVLSRPELWNSLREPYAGELIIPRKLRVGHRVHVNPFAYNPNGRQVRLSSNFFSYGQCTAIDPNSGLTRDVAVNLIVAFLMSSFGQVQFEMEAYNREGARSIEQHQLENIRVFDPRWIRPSNRLAILAATSSLPYPVPTDRDPRTQPALIALDKLFADEIVFRTPTLNKTVMLNEVWQTLAEWLQARRP